LAALAQGAPVELTEKSAFPRHKVCGEFLSPGIGPVLERLAVWDQFMALRPAPIRRMTLYFGNREKQSALPETAWGLSRYAFDEMLFREAVHRGARSRRGTAIPEERPLIQAAGRMAAETRTGSRLFGFKAHFTGPVDDVLELFFFDSCYAGVCPVEDGITNVCGLAPEGLLRTYGFDMDRISGLSEPLARRLSPLSRKWKWLTTGPLVFRNRFRGPIEPGIYPTGDVLSFVDPFTGSGILSALLTGELAGQAAASNTPVEDYLKACRNTLGRPFEASSVFRGVLAGGWAPRLAPFVRAEWLYRMTRPVRT
jgi:flavin-dependent dehydrogenase